MGVISIFSTILFFIEWIEKIFSGRKSSEFRVFLEPLSKILAKFPFHNINISIFP